MHDNSLPDAIPFRTLPRLPGAVLGVLALLVVVGIVTAFVAAGVDAGRMWQSLLFNWLFWSSLAMGMVVFAAALNMSNAHWAWSVRRLALGGAAFLPISLLLLVVVFFGSEHLFSHWLHAEGDPIIEAKSAYLNLPFLIGRDLLLVGGLYALALMFLYYNVRPDVYGAGKNGHQSLYSRLTRNFRGVPEEARRSHHILARLAPIIALLYALIFGMVATDLAMSLAPHWFSTMFPVAFIWTGFHGGVAATAIAAAFVRSRVGLDEFITGRQYHDLGKLVFAFSIFWMYLNWAQYVVIWYGLLPWEQAWMVDRFREPFGLVVQAMVLLVFVVPFLGLLTRPPKQVPGILAGFGVLILLGHWLERYLLVVPSLWEGQGGLPLGFIEIGIGLGFAGLFLASYLWYARSFPLLPSPASLAAHNEPAVAVPATATEP